MSFFCSPLHLAARNGLVQVTCKLLKTGASVLSVDSDGLTPALSCAPNLQVAQCLSLILKSYLQSNNKDCSGKSFSFHFVVVSFFNQFLCCKLLRKLPNIPTPNAN